MSTLKEKHILEAVNKITQLSEVELEEMSEKHTNDQVLFFSYLLSSAIEFENDELLDLVAFYFNIYLEAASIQQIKLRKIDDDLIDDFHEEYTDTLDEYMETEDDDLIKSLCNQPAMLDFLLNEIHGEDEDGGFLSDKMKSELFIVGIAMVALFNRAIIE
ncbi:MAG: hypothetical protein WC994_09040 [Brumimicrobium sp.]